MFEEFTQDRTQDYHLHCDHLICFHIGHFHLPNSPNSPILCLCAHKTSHLESFSLQLCNQFSGSKLNSIFSVKPSLAFPSKEMTPLSSEHLPFTLNLLQALSTSDLAPSLLVLKAASPLGCVCPSLSPLQSLPRAWHAVVLRKTSAETHWWCPRLIFFTFYHFSYSPAQLSNSSGSDSFSFGPSIYSNLLNFISPFTWWRMFW